MTDVLFEQQVVQNPGLGAETIWHAVREAYELNGRTEGVPILLAFIILPLIFHKRTAIALASKTRPGAIYKAIVDDRELTIGLQERTQGLSDRTFQSLSIGLSTNLLLLDHADAPYLIPGRKSPPIAHVTDDVKMMMKAAKRVGQAFSELPPAQLFAHLKIRF